MRMAKRYPAPPAITNRDQVADLILDRLHGYVRRQGSVPHDRAYVRSLLDQWDREVKTLQATIERLQQISEPTPKRRFPYLRFILGLTECPTL